jgi:hypothetical protein
MKLDKMPFRWEKSNGLDMIALLVSNFINCREWAKSTS